MQDADRRATEERQLALLVGSAVDYAIFLLDPSGHILTWNPGAQRLKGYTREEIVGRHFSTFYTASDRARDHPAEELRIAEREGRYQEEGWRVRKDGTTFWASVTITTVRDEEGTLIGFGKVTRDLTERKVAEDQAQRAVEELRKANGELDRFAAAAAHDMAEPLRTIAGYAELMCDGDTAPERTAEFARHIHTSAARLDGMLKALLAYARAGGVHDPPVGVPVRPVVEQVIADLHGTISERGARVSVQVPGDSVVAAQPGDLVSILQNLVANAVKFANEERPAVTVSAASADTAETVITVTDNGPGIAAADRGRIFKPFERAHGGQSGYGLGLAICQRLVERHGGTIQVESELGRGSRFVVRLPVPRTA